MTTKASNVLIELTWQVLIEGYLTLLFWCIKINRT